MRDRILAVPTALASFAYNATLADHVVDLIKSYSRPLEQKVSHFPQILFGLSSHGRCFGRGTGADCMSKDALT